MTIGVVVVPLAVGLGLGFLLTCISVWVIHPEPKPLSNEEMIKRLGDEYEMRLCMIEGAEQ